MQQWYGGEKERKIGTDHQIHVNGNPNVVNESKLFHVVFSILFLIVKPNIVSLYISYVPIMLS